jgi:hypothetical protein
MILPMHELGCGQVWVIGNERGERLGVVEVKDASSGNFELQSRPTRELIVAG